jgi:pyruvate/2-oxoglutarate dehydrogenase complex dihydrolipoamide dehydrogenase (E3) component
MGGDCLNTGCVPSKALIAAAKHAHSVREAADFGIKLSKPDVNFAAVHRHVHDVIAAVQPNDTVERFTGLGVKVIQAAAHFTDKRTVIAGDFEIRARRFVLASGSRPAVPPIPDLHSVPYLTNETVFSLRRRPSHLMVIGGGPIGMELAQAFHRLGSQVTVFQSGRALPRDDPEMSAILLRLLRAEGIDIREGVSVTRVAKRSRGGIRLTLSDGSWTDGSHILLAAGRRPTIAGLGLKEAGIAHDDRGIRVNSRLRTTNRRVYAIGDVTGGHQFTHWAGYQAGQALRSILFRFGGKMKPDILPWVTYTDPELAHVGLRESDARLRHRSVRVLRWPFSENDRAQTERATQGHVKIVTNARGRVLGAEILGRNAGELIGLWALAVANGMKVQSVLGVVFPYPTLSEASKRAALSFFTPKLGSKVVRRTIRFLRLFG